ncbi:YhcN/YlaJ family sporulation lipoprotein [Gorillibacterium sp. CAU 1737]|uniref:YhcN/YlaJ family sporulation lipoprotein n=1 Tax=Gorillibacterium sp. CAU 1737 TaxID=3140362 RepID=UPI003260A151
MKRQTLIMLLAISLILVFSNGCSARNMRPQSYHSVGPIPQNEQVRSESHRMPHEQTGVKTEGPYIRTQGYRTPASSERAVADKTAEQLTTVNGIQMATALIHGNHVLIGLDIPNMAQENQAKNQATRIVKGLHPHSLVHVTTDKNLIMRIQGLRMHLEPTDGQSVRYYSDDVGILITDIDRIEFHSFR